MLSCSLLMGCVADSPSTDAGESESGGQGTGTETESGSLPTDTTESESETQTETDTDTGTDTETEGETGVDPTAFDPSCGEWTSTLFQADRLDEVQLDGDQILATGGRALVERGDGGEWSNYIDFSLDTQILAYHDVWGPPGDRWVFGQDGTGEAAIYKYDGDSLTLHETLTYQDPQASSLLARELVGRGPDDVWALAAPVCVCFFTPCTCIDDSELMHWDGQSWSSVPTPGQLFDIALTETGIWGVGQSALIARYDGQNWTTEDFGAGSFEHVWALDDDEIWVGGGDPQLMHRSGGVWTGTELPDPWSTVIALEGRATNQVWALDDDGGVWAYDGDAWTELTELPGAGGLAIVGEGESLIVVGGYGSEMVWEVDTSDGSSMLLHHRVHVSVRTMIADDVDHLLFTAPGNVMWSVKDGVWQLEYEDINRINALLGPIDEAIGVRNNDNYPDAVWQLGENPAPLPDPIEVGWFNAVIEHDGQLWVGGSDVEWPPHERSLATADRRQQCGRRSERGRWSPVRAIGREYSRSHHVPRRRRLGLAPKPRARRSDRVRRHRRDKGRSTVGDSLRRLPRHAAVDVGRRAMARRRHALAANGRAVLLAHFCAGLRSVVGDLVRLRPVGAGRVLRRHRLDDRRDSARIARLELATADGRRRRWAGHLRRHLFVALRILSGLTLPCVDACAWTATLVLACAALGLRRGSACCER
jgi:hypothetical protein